MKALAATALLATLTTSATAQVSGSGTTTRYWDCCKPSCAWTSSSLTSPVQVCDVNDQPIADGGNTASGCTGGSAYMCSSQSPWAISDSLAYGFAAVSASAPNCCACYKLTFTSTAISGKTMIVQATNTGTDVGSTQFDIAMPGGGFGLYDACTTEWKATSAIWGAQYGGSSTNTCSQFPTALQPGCGFRWDWMEGADNPTVDFETIDCPAEIVAKSGCSISGSTPAAGSSSSADAAAASSSPSSTMAAPSSSSSLAPVNSPSTTAAGESPSSSDMNQAAVTGSTSTIGTSATISSLQAYIPSGGPGPDPLGVSSTNSTTATANHRAVHHPWSHKTWTTTTATPSPANDADNDQDECEL